MEQKLSIGRRKLVDTATTLEAPFTIEELKRAKALAEGLLVVHGTHHTLQELIRDHRLSAQAARQKETNIPDSPLSPSER